MLLYPLSLIYFFLKIHKYHSLSVFLENLHLIFPPNPHNPPKQHRSKTQFQNHTKHLESLDKTTNSPSPAPASKMGYCYHSKSPTQYSHQLHSKKDHNSCSFFPTFFPSQLVDVLIIADTDTCVGTPKSQVLLLGSGVRVVGVVGKCGKKR